MLEQIQEYDVNETIWLNALFLTGATLGTIAKASQFLYVRDVSDLTLTAGAKIVVVGAGAVGGDLSTTVVSADGQVITLANAALSAANLTDVGNPADPTTVTCQVMKPDGSKVSATVSNPSQGRYRASYTPATDGDYYYRFTGTGTATADAWRKFTVRPERVA